MEITKFVSKEICPFLLVDRSLQIQQWLDEMWPVLLNDFYSGNIFSSLICRDLFDWFRYNCYRLATRMMICSQIHRRVLPRLIFRFLSDPKNQWDQICSLPPASSITPRKFVAKQMRKINYTVHIFSIRIRITLFDFAFMIYDLIYYLLKSS